MLNADGPLETAAVSGHVVEDRKVDRIVGELARFRVEATGLQETKWFGAGVYCVGDAVVLASGRPLPNQASANSNSATNLNSCCRRGEGVALVLRGRTRYAFEYGGCQWSAVSSRILVARLKFDLASGGVSSFSVVVCYAPTFRSPRSVKDEFFNSFQDVLSAIDGNDQLVLLGDFNARIGVCTDDDVWYGVRGPHGMGAMNDAGQELLEFLARNELSVCNSWFRKRTINLQTWQHPRSKAWHCIDYIITRQRDRKFCIDCHVIRQAECSTDHQLLCLTYNLPKLVRKCHRVQRTPATRRFAVEKFRVSHNMTEEEKEAVLCTQHEYRHSVEEGLVSWKDHVSLGDKWSCLKSAVVDAATSTIGRCKRLQSDWFVEKATILEPLIAKRNSRYREWIDCPSEERHRRFKESRGATRAAVRDAKNDYIQGQASIAEQGRFSGKRVWTAIRSIQRCYSGLHPKPMCAVKDDDGAICSSPEDQKARWKQHFTRVLNIQSTFSIDALASVPAREEDPLLAIVPSEEDLLCALRRLCSGKAGGGSQIVPELLKAGGSVLFPFLFDLVKTAWLTSSVPQDWRDAQLVPIPKKGDLSLCDNWRGIALLDVVGKVVGRIIQDRLQLLAATSLPESQCGFRPGRSCADAAFSVRQVVEKSFEHRVKSFCIFVDLRKAYDSIPRAALWIALRKIGVPDSLVNLIASFHTDMKATVRVGGGATDELCVENGLRQGCTMAPILFNLYFGVVVQAWLCTLQSAEMSVGVSIHSHINGDLFSCAKRRQRDRVFSNLSDFEFADDAVLISQCRDSAVWAVSTFCEVASKFGLSVNCAKTKFMVVGSGVVEEDCAPISVNSGVVENVSSFVYLGSEITPDSRSTSDIQRRRGCAARAFGALRNVFLDRNLSLATKRHLYSTCVAAVLLYGSECWTTVQADLQCLDAFHHRCIRTIMQVSRRQQREEEITSEELRHRWGDATAMSEKVRVRRLEWLGHLARMEPDRLPKRILFGAFQQTRPFCGPRQRWKDVITRDMKSRNIPVTWYEVAQDRVQWRQLIHLPTPVPVLNDPLNCGLCSRSFRRAGDHARHKCLAERQLPIPQQSGSVQCERCLRWFRSKGGYSVHRCVDSPVVPQSTPQPTPDVSTAPACCCKHCHVCNRCFKSVAGYRRHNCSRGKRVTANDRQQFEFHCVCGRNFRRRQDLTRHAAHCSLTPLP